MLVGAIRAKPDMRMCGSLHFQGIFFPPQYLRWERMMGIGIRRRCICAREWCDKEQEADIQVFIQRYSWPYFLGVSYGKAAQDTWILNSNSSCGF